MGDSGSLPVSGSCAIPLVRSGTLLQLKDDDPARAEPLLRECLDAR